MKKIIVCDDDKEIAESIKLFLQNDEYSILKCHNGKDAIELLNRNHIDLIIMDIMMPGDDGIKTVMKIRETSNVPVLFLSAKSETNDKIQGLNAGGDDYITKPFDPLELKARVNAILKRTNIANDKKNKKIYRVGNLKLNQETKEVTLNDDTIKVTPIEYKILLLFMKNIGKVLSSNEIYKNAWDDSEAFNIENTVAVHIRHLREKIESDSREPKYIKVVWGIGYKMEAT